MDEKVRAAMKQEALSRIEELCDEMGLNPNVYCYFEENKVYYSYLTAGGIIGSIDTINYDSRYAEAVKQIEARTGALIYHVIETNTQFGTMLSMLYVSKYKEDWSIEHLEGDMIYAMVCLLDNPTEYEVGSIALSSKQGALIRIG